MVASSESPSWRRLDNGVQEKLAPPTSPTPHFLDTSPTNDLNDPMLPSSSATMKNLDEPAVFAVPAVPKKANKKVLPLTPATATTRSKNRKNAHKKSKPSPSVSRLSDHPGGQAGKTSVGLVGSPERKKHRREPGTESVKRMFVSLRGLLGKHHAEETQSLKQRISRLSSFMVHRAGEDTLKTATSSFHDFLNRESYKPDTKSSLPFSLLGDDTFRSESTFSSPKRKGRNEEGPGSSSTATSSKNTEQQSIHDLFGVLSVSRDDMKNKTPSQLVEFVKRVESNQRREAFEKQQRPAYLLKLARTQSVDRAKLFSGVAQGFQRAVDRINDDPWVTDSSSGGESADEAEEELFQKKFDQDRLIPVDQRALHRYAETRQGIASRYSYAHRQLARAEYAYQVTGNLLQRIQQRQGIVTFGGGTVDDSRASSKTASLAHKGPTPRPWDDREVVTVSKTPNCATVLRLPTAKSDAGQSLHPSLAGLFRRKMKVVLPSTGLNIPFETYEATMWKERLAVGRIIHDESDEEDVGEDDVEPVNLSEAVVSSARGCARARPLVGFKKRTFVDMDSFPPKRYQTDEKPRHCDCSARSLRADLVGPVSCGVCMGLLPIPSFSSHINLLKTPRKEAMALVDLGYHPRLSQPSIRSLDAELSGVALDFNPSAFISSKGPFKPRPMRRQRALDLIKTEAEAARILRKQEERVRLERERLRALRFGALDNNRDGPKRPKSKGAGDAKKSRGHRNRTVSMKGRKRRHSSVSSDTTVSSAVSNVTRSPSVGSVDHNIVATKNAVKRQLHRDRGNSKSVTGKSNASRKREIRSDLTSFVIPYGMTAPSKIEKIQYKEIVVPKFRDLKTVPILNGPPPTTDQYGDPPTPADQSLPRVERQNPEYLPDDPDSGLDEDLTDAAFAERHSKCETEERHRFTLPEKQPRKRVPAPEGAPPRPTKNKRKKSVLLMGKSLKARRKSKGNRNFGRNDPRKKEKVVLVASLEGEAMGGMQEKVVKVQSDKAKRPRKTADELAQLNAQRPARPVRTRRSTFRASPDDEDG